MPLRASNGDLGIGGGGPDKLGGRDNLFWWTVFLISLAGVGIACWVGSFYVFGHPEKSRPYQILTRLGKLPPPMRFLVTKAPPGEFWGPQRVFEQYSKLTSLQLERENETLFRNYLRNYGENKRPVRYLTGTFTILKAYELQDSDVLTSGVVALSQAEEFPQLLVELLYPTPRENVAALLQMLRPGLGVKLEKTLDLSAILHVGHAMDGRLQVTAVPLLYGSYAVLNGNGSFSLQPPAGVNVAAGFPLVRGEEVRSVLFDQLESRRRRVVMKEPLGPESASGPQLVRVTSEGPREISPPSLSPTPITQSPPQSLPASVSPGQALAVVPAQPVELEVPAKSAGGPPEASGRATGRSMDAQGAVVLDAGTSKTGSGAGGLGVLAVGSEGGTPGGGKPETDRKVAVEGPGKTALGGVVSGSGPGSGGDVAKGRSVFENPVAQAFAAAPPPISAVSTGRIEGSKVPPVGRGNGGGSGQVPPEAGVISAQPVASQAPGGAAAAARGSLKGNSGASRDPSLQGPPAGGSLTPGRSEPMLLAQNGAVSTVAAPSSGMKAPASASTTSRASYVPEAKAFVAAAPAAIPVSPVGNWKTYGSGQQPGGRVVSTEQATAYADRTDAGRLYLRGQFVVTATGNGRAVLRQARTDDRSPAARVIVEYPAGAVPPAQGSSIARDDGRGFEIREVRKSPDGQVNIFVREISAP
jgi:hypothetical protein